MNYNELAFEFLTFMRSMGEVHAEKKVSDMIGGSMFILQILYDNLIEDERPYTPSEISSKLNISTARVATSLNMLENKGYINRDIDKLDKRKFNINLTNKGIAIVKDRREEMLNNVINLLENLGEDDSKDFVRIAKKISIILIDKYTIDRKE